ncbi:hypothetical protein HDU96_000327 [Phlyctochytrium bullatum]|nr:hypothetical protein HDU96_000327 [Phlyctochytrium bullatum]
MLRRAVAILLLVVVLLLTFVAADFKARYIVVFKKESFKSGAEDLIAKVKEVGGKFVSRLEIINGVTVEVPNSFGKTLPKFPGVDYVEMDQPVYAYKEQAEAL